MTDLEQLKEEILKCPTKGTSNKRHYAPELRQKVVTAASIYGKNHVANFTGISSGLIGIWKIRYSSKKVNGKDQVKKKGGRSKNRAIIINELPPIPLESHIPVAINNIGPILKLTSPQGFCLEVSSCTGQELVSIFNTFIGGMR